MQQGYLNILQYKYSIHYDRLIPVGSGGAEDTEEEGMDSNRGTKLLKAVGMRTRRHCLAGYLMMWRNLVKCCGCDGGVVWFCRKTSLGRQLMKLLGVKCYCL